MTMTPEMMEHISSATCTATQKIEKAYALGVDAGNSISKHTAHWDQDNALKSALKTVKQQEEFMAQLSKLVYEHKSPDAIALCLDYGWCIGCYTYSCYGDCS